MQENSMNVSSNTDDLHEAIKFGTKNQMLQVLQTKEVHLTEHYKKVTKEIHLIFQNENLAEKHVVELLEAFFDRGFDPNTKNDKEHTLLHFAVAKKWRDVVDLLISRNADISTRDEEGNTIAHFFVEDENEKWRHLLKDKTSCSNPMEEIENESTTFAVWLISKGFDFYCKNEDGDSAFYLAVKYNLQYITIALLKNIRNENFVHECDGTLLNTFIHANTCGRNGSAYYVLKKQWDPSYVLNIVKLFLDKGVSTTVGDLKNKTCLQIAIEEEDQSIIEMLLDHRLKNSEENSETITFLDFFKTISWWENSNTEFYFKTLHDLITRGVYIDSRDEEGKTALYHAFDAKSPCAIDFLNEYSADFSVITNDKENLFHALAKRKRKDWEDMNENIEETLFDLIVSKGCYDVNLQNISYKKTPLHVACHEGKFSIVRKLVEYGADVNLKNIHGLTPLSTAMDYETDYDQVKKVAELLLRNGANVNSKDRDGNRPLFYAVDTKQSAIVRLFLEWGAYVNDYPNDEPPFAYAFRNDYSPTINEMLEYGLDINDDRIVTLVEEYGSEYRPAKIVLQHWVKLKAANLPRSNKYEAFVEDNEYQKLYQECLKEVESLKNTMIDSFTSIYAFLHMDLVSRCIHINNEELRNLVDSPKLQERFSNYSVVILAGYHETVAWRKLLKPAKRAWRELSNVELLEECIELILSNLRIEDLVIMIEHDGDV